MYVIFHFKHHIFFLVIMIGTYTGTDEIICIPKRRRNKFFKTNSTKKKTPILFWNAKRGLYNYSPKI